MGCYKMRSMKKNGFVSELTYPTTEGLVRCVNATSEIATHHIKQQRSSTMNSFQLVSMIVLLLAQRTTCFVQPSPLSLSSSKNGVSQALSMDVSAITEASHSLATAAEASSGMLLAETEAWVQPTALLLGPFLNFLSFAMLCRVVASWYPETNLNKVPWIFVAWPTEPLLRLVKGVVPPAFGVDITPVFWLAIFTFLNEILLGQQGLLVMKMKYGI